MSPSPIPPKLDKKSKIYKKVTYNKSLTNKPSSSILISCQVAIHMISPPHPYHNPTPSLHCHVTPILPSKCFISILIFKKNYLTKFLATKFKTYHNYFYQIIPYRASVGVACYVVHFLFVSFELVYQFETWKLLKWFCTN